jgi:hypothetical protein
MELTRSIVTTKASEYRETQPLAAVEEQHVEILPEMLAEGEFGWRDVEWVVQWYFRRHLGAYPGRERRETEGAFDDNTYEDVLNALSGVTAASGADGKLRELRTLDGVDVSVGSAFLQFMSPGEYVVASESEWSVLQAAGELPEEYPERLSIEGYVTYHDACSGLTDRFDVDAYTLYRALWQLQSERGDSV